MGRKSKIYNFSEEEVQQIIETSLSFSDACEKFGFSKYGQNGRKQIEKRCEELNISTEHFSSYAKYTSHQKYNLEDILVENSTYTARARLKTRLLREGLLENKCYICGNEGEWQGKPLSLQLDHINGINNDNRLENLRLLCPNCHSQTETFSGKHNKTTSC